MQFIIVIILVVLGAIGYTLMLKDIKNPNRNTQELIGRPYYWCLLLFIGGLTTTSIGVISSIFQLSPSSKWPIILIGSILMVVYIISFLFIPRNYFIKKYRK